MVDVRTQLITLAHEQRENGDHIMAIRYLNTAIRLNPNNPDLYYDRSICHYKLGDYQSGLEDVNTAIRLNFNDHSMHYQKGLALLGLGLFNEGIVSFKKAIELLAMQEDSKLSQIFNVIADASRELHAAKVRFGLNKKPKMTGGRNVVQESQESNVVVGTESSGTNHHHLQVGTISNTDHVDSTTDQTPVSLMMESGASSFDNRGLNPLETCFRNTGHNSLVATKRNTNSTVIINNNNNQQPIQAQLINGGVGVGAGGSDGSTNTSCLVATAGGCLVNHNRVSSTASHINNNNIITNRHISSLQMTAATTSAAANVLSGTMPAIINPSMINPANNMDLMGTSGELVDESRAAQFAWNIRRSERIFLHHTNEPGTSASTGMTQDSSAQQQSVPSSAIASTGLRHRPPPANSIEEKESKKRSYDCLNEPNQQAYQNQTMKSKEGSNSFVESEIDVDDSIAIASVSLNPNLTSTDTNVSKRVMIAPSSSMPATRLEPSTSASSSSSITNTTTKDDSYSSKYKRLRRDRERARRGTSKLCTIKLSDLEDLHKCPEASNSNKRTMRVIAPIDGWLYSGQLSVDNSLSNNGVRQYVVKLDGDATNSSYLFSQEIVLNDVIKEVRVKTVSELRKGARICCYWSRQYKCLSTGVVTSRTFEETKSLVSVKYDNGDLSALPLEDLRLLPPDYPKYMSNCDPLLLARNGDGVGQQTNTTMATTMPIRSGANVNPNGTRIVIMENKTLSSQQQQHTQLQEPRLQRLPQASNSEGLIIKHATNSVVPANDNKFGFVNVASKSQPTIENTQVLCPTDRDQGLSSSPEERPLEVDESYFAEQQSVSRNSQLATETEPTCIDDDEDSIIPTTDETIEFITSENSMKLEIGENHCHENDDDDAATDEDPSLAEQANGVTKITKDEMELETAGETAQQDNTTANSRASSEENNYGVTYCPWLFVGPPKRNKKHGRAYRDYYTSIRRGNEEIKVGDSAELMPRDESILPFIAKVDGFWATARGEMKVRVRWYYRLVETEGEPYEMPDGENALFETDHYDENDVQSIYRSTKILSWTDYNKDNLGHVNKSNDNAPKIFYLAGYYDPVRRTKHLRSDIKKAL